MLIKKIDKQDAPRLLTISIQTFYELLADKNDAADMEEYSAQFFSLESINVQLNNPNSLFYFANFEDENVGYLKLNFNGAQVEFQDINGMEIERIYVLNKFQHNRIGSKLLEFALSIAVSKRLKYVWLGVWEHNLRAIRFYEHFGFKIVGSHEFVLGKDRQKDLLMKKEL